jgi:hypothetical protein
MRSQTNDIYETTAILINTRTDAEVPAEIGEFKDKQSLNAYVAGNKVRMTWNGKTYVGNIGGMELTTSGPKLLQTIKTRGRY